MKEKLLFFDIDGTLIESHHGINTISNETRNSLKKLQENGHKVFLATGRCKCFIIDGVMDYPFDGYVTCNGAYVEYQDNCIYKKVIPSEAIKATHQFCKEYKTVCYFESNDNIYVSDINDEKHQAFKVAWMMKEKTVINDYDIDNIEVYLGMIILNNLDDAMPLMKALSPYFNIQMHINGLSFDLTLKGESKAIGIEKLIDRLGKDMEDTIAFGDGRNDIEMLETVNLGIAMGNGAAEAKKAANYVTKSIENEGITDALKHFKLI